LKRPNNERIKILWKKGTEAADEAVIQQVMIKAGDTVRFEKMPEWVRDLPKESQQVFQECLGKSFTVTEIDKDNLYVLNVSKLVDPMIGGFQNDIRLEDQYLKKH